MPDAIFADSRLAPIYDRLEFERGDLDVYAAIVDELGARSVLDVGCGTGTFALLLAARGIDVTGIDPAAASLDVARGKPGAGRVRWLSGDARALPLLQVELVTMTANVAQAIVDPDDWVATLRGAHAALRPGGHLVFETRDPAYRAWEGWHRAATDTTTDIPGVGPVRRWSEVLEVALPLVTFRFTYEFAADGAVLTSTSTLRFRERDEVAEDLHANGFIVTEVRDAPDRPGREFVFLRHPQLTHRPPKSPASVASMIGRIPRSRSDNACTRPAHSSAARSLRRRSAWPAATSSPRSDSSRSSAPSLVRITSRAPMSTWSACDGRRTGHRRPARGPRRHAEVHSGLKAVVADDQLARIDRSRRRRWVCRLFPAEPAHHGSASCSADRMPARGTTSRQLAMTSYPHDCLVIDTAQYQLSTIGRSG